MYIYIYIHIYITTTSTAQGGGGFEDRKPIREVCCSAAWMSGGTDGPKRG